MTTPALIAVPAALVTLAAFVVALTWGASWFGRWRAGRGAESDAADIRCADKKHRDYVRRSI